METDETETPVVMEARSVGAVVLVLVVFALFYFFASFAACWLALELTR